MFDRIQQVTGATSVRRDTRIQSLWSGYGEVVRYTLEGASMPSVVVKHVRPPKDSGRSHSRKLRSYEVEQNWYTDWSARCGSRCRVPALLHAERSDGEWLFVLEDLDAAGFASRTRRPNQKQRAACIRWLAAFHATFMQERPRGLWKVGTYWHLATRPDELRAMGDTPLARAATAIDARLSGARFQTLVHGDAKPANFCFARKAASVAAVDFQYVGGGCGMKDVAYFCAGEDRRTTEHLLDLYFAALRTELTDADAIEAEWRDLFPWAVADFQRFIAGWSPGWHENPYSDELTRSVLATLGT